MRYLATGLLLVLSASISITVTRADSSMQHLTVVQENPADFTPWLVPSAAVNKPHIDAIGQIGRTLYAGGYFDTVAHPGGAPVYARSHFVAFDSEVGTPKSAVDPGFTD